GVQSSAPSGSEKPRAGTPSSDRVGHVGPLEGMTGIGHSARRPFDRLRGRRAERDPPKRIPSDVNRTKSLLRDRWSPMRDLEGMTGIEPALSAWEADVLPLNYIPER